MNPDTKKYTDSFLLRNGRRAGVCQHIPSLPGPHGIGDIADSAVAFLDTVTGMGLRVWQFLPTGPTAYGDSPYQPLSAFAGNAMLVGLNPLVRLGLLKATELETCEALPCDSVDYGRIIPLKRELLIEVAKRFHSRPGHGLLPAYEEFLHHNSKLWLDDYALFRVLKILHGERPWREWGKEYVHRNPVALEKLWADHREAIDCVRVAQFLFWSQWKELRVAADEKGVCLFGDMPIYIALDSVDAWAHPEMLLIDQDGRPAQVAGVPPDYFSEDGQLWGNPLYDWDYHKQTGYQWWIERMRHIGRQTDLVRIDHFRGFESFWSVQYGEKTAKNGKWLPGPGEALFEAMRKSLGFLPIVAEDLGVITPAVDKLRLDQGFPGMVVLQFEVGDPDFKLEEISENSVCYTGTHDNDTTAGWFRGNGDDTRSSKELAETRARTLRVTGGTEDTIHTDMIRLAFSSNSALAIAPMQDFLGLGSEARLNIPGTTLNNWRWRLESGQLHPATLESICTMVEEASRSRSKHIESTA